ncbi:MAG TPA: class I SAM-dependent methyltransferase [Segetibacter sp.]
MNNDTFLTNWINSPYYAQYHQDEQEQRSSFVKALIDRISPAQHSKILEVGCGAGANSRFISQQGFDVTGIDFSFEAISKAKEYETDNLHFFQHDIRLPFWINYFDYAVNLFTAFGRYVTLREHNNALRVIAQSLNSGGLFVLDYFNIGYKQNLVKEKEEKTIDNLHFEINNWQDEENFHKKIKVIENGFLKDTFTDKLVKFSLEDLTGMLSQQNLQVQKVYGDYNFNNYNVTNSPRLIIIAKK